MTEARPSGRISRAFIRFANLQSSGGIVMMSAAALALIIANTPLRDAYEALWHTYAGLVVGEWELKMSLLHWVNDGLMAVFFFLVGLEIKREILFGELASLRRAALPVLAALGGAIVPALIYLSLNHGTPYERGWGIPMATDIAFAVAILAMLGSRAPLWLKTFVTALAIADDLMAVVVIALFYSGAIDLGALGWGAAALGVMFILNRRGAQNPALYVIPAIVAWYFVYQSGVHATIAGVAAAAMIPAGRSREKEALESLEISTSLELATQTLELAVAEAEDVLEAKDLKEDALAELAEEAHESAAALYRMEHAINPWVAFMVLPVFAFANSGIALGRVPLTEMATHPITLGILLGLFIGKQVGITGAAWLAVKLGLGDLPPGASWRVLWGGAALAGIGFTMSIFIASLAFTDPELLDLAKVGIVEASLLAAAMGIILLRTAPRPSEDAE